ncbi:MAG: prepilin-type N-terminal cleavage/methylation domain-containing protein [Patescibacteria group bacterium]
MNKIFKNQSGFTLVELLIAIAIMVMLLGAAITYLPAYRNQQVLRQGSLDVNNSLRQAQTLAFAPDENNVDYYVWEILDNGADVGCLTENYISVWAGLKPAPTEPAHTTCLDDKILIDFVDGVDKLYFQVQTGKIFADDALSVPAYGQIEVKHTAMQDVDDYYYNIGIYNDSFDLLNSTVGEPRELPAEQTVTVPPPLNNGGEETPLVTDEGASYGGCNTDADCQTGFECVISASQVKYCAPLPVCGNGTIETGEQCGEPGLQCLTNQNCDQCVCVAKTAKCPDGGCDANENSDSCPSDCPVRPDDGYCDTNSGENYWNAPQDCEAPPIDSKCSKVSFCTSNTQCLGGTCLNYRCDCTRPANPDLKNNGSSCEVGSECATGYCVLGYCSGNDYICRYLPQYCT